MVKYVLVVETGGVHVATAARVLADLETDLGQPLSRRFDLFAGTGFGGVLALALASDQFTAHGAQAKLASKHVLAHVLESNVWRRTRGIVQDMPLATGAAKREFFRTAFKDNTPLSDVEKPVVLPAYDITARATVTFSSRADHPVFNPLISETLDAVTATPIFFPPVTLTGMADGLQGTGRSMPVPMQHAFIDGAVVSGAALLPAIAEARRLWPREDRLVVVVVGPGRPARSVVVPPGGMGGPQWLQSDLVGIAMEAGLTDVQLRTILGPSVDLIRVSGINQSVSDDFDDTNVANVDALDALGRAWYLDCRAALIRLLVAQLDGGPQLGSAMASQAASPTFLTPSSLPALSPLPSSVPASVPSPAPLAPVAGAVPLASLSITTTGLAGAPAPEAPLPSAPAASSVCRGDAATAADVLASNSPQAIAFEPMPGKPSKATKAARAADAEGTDKDKDADKGKGKGKAAPKASTKGKKKDDSSDDEGDEEEEESSGKDEDEDEDSDEEEDEEDEVEEEDEDEDEEDEGDEDDAEGEEDEDDEEEEGRSQQGGNCVVS